MLLLLESQIAADLHTYEAAVSALGFVGVAKGRRGAVATGWCADVDSGAGSLGGRTSFSETGTPAVRGVLGVGFMGLLNGDAFPTDALPASCDGARARNIGRHEKARCDYYTLRL